MPPKSGRSILACYSRNVKPPYLCKTCPVVQIRGSPASPALTISIAKRKRSLWPSSPPSFSAPLRLRQGRRASTYLQENSRVDERFLPTAGCQVKSSSRRDAEGRGMPCQTALSRPRASRPARFCLGSCYSGMKPPNPSAAKKLPSLDGGSLVLQSALFWRCRDHGRSRT